MAKSNNTSNAKTETTAEESAPVETNAVAQTETPENAEEAIEAASEDDTPAVEQPAVETIPASEPNAVLDDGTLVRVPPEPTVHDDGLDDLPEGAVLVEDAAISPVQSAIPAGLPYQNVTAFNDEFVGQGGSYMIGEDGVRRPVYEKYQAPAPGARGAAGEFVTKYRAVK